MTKRQINPQALHSIWKQITIYWFARDHNTFNHSNNHSCLAKRKPITKYSGDAQLWVFKPNIEPLQYLHSSTKFAYYVSCLLLCLVLPLNEIQENWLEQPRLSNVKLMTPYQPICYKYDQFSRACIWEYNFLRNCLLGSLDGEYIISPNRYYLSRKHLLFLRNKIHRYKPFKQK